MALARSDLPEMVCNCVCSQRTRLSNTGLAVFLPDRGVGIPGGASTAIRAARSASDAANAINGASNAADVAGPGARATTDIVATTNGLVNVRSTIDRIKAGDKLPHRHDGSVFQNREGLLPKQIDGYYREFVHPTPGVNGPGAQRVIQGQNGELYYSPDHYRTFVPLN